MNPNIESGLAFLLFLPAFVVLGALYCLFPRQPRNVRRHFADAAVLVFAAALSITTMRWGFATSITARGHLWPQIVATLLAYGVFMATLCIALFVRAKILRRLR